MDWSAYKKILVDEYIQDYPEHSEDELRAFITGMNWLIEELDITTVIKRLQSEFNIQTPDARLQNAFCYGLERLRLVINDQTILTDRLNDHVPEKVSNDYLREELKKVVNIIAENDSLRKKNKSLSAIIENNSHLSKSELSQLKKEAEYVKLRDELNKLRQYKDLYFMMLAKLYNKQ